MSRQAPVPLQFADGTCLLWAVLALARLDEKIPSEDEALYLSVNHRDGRALRLRNKLFAIVEAFADPMSLRVWDSLYEDHANSLISELLRAATNYYQELNPEFLLLHRIIKAFNTKIQSERVQHPAEAFGAIGMVYTIANQMSRLLAPKMSEILITLNAISENITTDQIASELTNYAEEQAGAVSQIIEQFVRDQTELMTANHLDVNADMFVQVLQGPLRECLHAAFNTLFRNLAPWPGMIIDQVDRVTRMDLNVFYRNIADFFSYASPLLSQFWIPESDSDDASLDEEDLGWYWEQYEPNHLIDVLDGPENVHVDQVSVVITTNPELNCTICFDSQLMMRALKACGHAYCEDCLNGQLHTYHASRYKCASCRQSFF